MEPEQVTEKQAKFQICSTIWICSHKKLTSIQSSVINSLVKMQNSQIRKWLAKAARASMLRSRAHKHLRQLSVSKLVDLADQTDMNRLRSSRHKNTQTAINSINSTADIQTELEVSCKRRKRLYLLKVRQDRPNIARRNRCESHLGFLRIILSHARLTTFRW